MKWLRNRIDQSMWTTCARTGGREENVSLERRLFARRFKTRSTCDGALDLHREVRSASPILQTGRTRQDAPRWFRPHEIDRLV